LLIELSHCKNSVKSIASSLGFRIELAKHSNHPLQSSTPLGATSQGITT